MRVALVHDKLTELGGSERVVQAMQRIWPDAVLHVAVADPAVVEAGGFRNVRTSGLDRVPGARRRWATPLQALAFATVHPSEVDVVVSSTSFSAKDVRPGPGIPHLSFVHTPARYLWGDADHLEGRSGPAPAAAVVRAARPLLRRVDRRAAQRVDALVTVSTFVAGLIERAWGRTAEVVPPPVDLAPYAQEVPTGGHVVALARLLPYKRVDVAIAVANELGLRLVVIGDGPDRARLERLAGPTVELVGHVDEATKVRLLGSARALLAPQVEDFGIATVEALAAGVPVAAPAAGGAVDIVRTGVTGALYDPHDPRGLTDAVRALLEHPPERSVLRAAAQRYSEPAFAQALQAQVELLLARTR
jgi:glycosyltransferase involved in cell wall biosynthesis